MYYYVFKDIEGGREGEREREEAIALITSYSVCIPGTVGAFSLTLGLGFLDDLVLLRANFLTLFEITIFLIGSLSAPGATSPDITLVHMYIVTIY